MRSFFDFLTRMALKFRAITLIIVVVIMGLGGVAATELQQELLPPIEFPQSFVLIQVSGMTSDEVLNVVTLRVEEEVAAVSGVVNVETQTSGTIGVFMLVSTEFGLDQDEIRGDIQAALDSVYFPGRSIVAPEGTDGEEFATELLGDLTPETVLYLSGETPTQFFQLSADVWADFSDETVETLVGYLANETNTPTGNVSALELLVEAEMVPQLDALDLVASISIEGGQALPGEEDASLQTVDASEVAEPESLLLQLSPEVWGVINERFDYGELTAETAESLAVEIELPETAPALPESWQQENYTDASDLAEMATFTQTIAAVLNNFEDTGVIRGALTTTEDLTPEAVQTMLDIQPSLANYFDGDQLAAMSPDVLEVIEPYLELDGLSRDALAAAILARSLSGEVELADPAVLPVQWRINPPQIITFSFADLPLATFSVFGTSVPGELDIVEDTTDNVAEEETSETDTPVDAAPALEISVNPAFAEVAEGPELPQLFDIVGGFLNYELDTADDLLKAQLPAEFEAFLGGSDYTAIINLLPQLNQFADALAGGGATEGDAAADPLAGISPADIGAIVPALIECDIALNDLTSGEPDLGALAENVLLCIDDDVFTYLAENDPSVAGRLSPEVHAILGPDVYAIDGYSPLLGETWGTLAARPEFADQPLATADDLLALGDGSAAAELNLINDSVTGQFEGYEVRLFDSLTAETVEYFVANGDDFFTTLSTDVLLKLSPSVLAIIPEDVLDSLDSDVVEQAQAIASGDAESAAQQIASQYESDVEPFDPSAPALNAEWAQIAGFYSVELVNAFDLIRFEDALGAPPAQFINNLYLSPNGASFAPALLGNMPLEVFNYLAENSDGFIATLTPRALNEFSDEVFASLDDATQERAQAGEVFVPDTQVTRTNGSSSLLVTIFKTSEANTVTAFAQVEEVINAIDANNDAIEVEVAFEQASFIEESISGVVLSGIMGAFFAIVNILVFLSGDTWGGRGRRISGTIVAVIAVALLAGFYFISGQDWNAMIAGEAVLITSLIIFGIIAGAIVLLYPGRLPYPAWRATLVIAVSIPLSIMSALALMNWLPGIVNGLLGDFDDIAVVAFLLRLAPDGLTLNIMTLSGLTVAVGRLVDDSIVVLENIFRQLQSGEMDKEEAVLYATRDVSVAIFSATSIAVLVFLPLGLTGGLIAEFFLPFGLAVTYTLLSSFVVAITVVPVLAYFLISAENVPAEEETFMERTYVPILSWVLGGTARRWSVIILAFASVAISGWLLSQRPAAFLPEFGEVQLTVAVTMPDGTGIIDTNDRVTQIEDIVRETIPEEDLATLRTTVGGGGLSFEALFTGGGVSENIADITIGLNSSTNFEAYVADLEENIAPLFEGQEEANYAVSSGTATGGGFGGFQLVVSGGPLGDLTPTELSDLNSEVIAALSALPELTDVTSNLPSAEEEEAEDVPITYIRLCSDGASCAPALTYTGALNTDDTINFTTTAIEAIEANVEFPEGVGVGQGFDSELQTEGFASIIVAMGIASVMIIVILIVVFRSPVYWFAVIFSVIVAPIGAAVALTVTDRVLGISSLIGILMLLGLVVTNAIVLIDRVGSNREERGMNLYDALISAGRRRLRPILMTALTTIIGLIPLALGVSEGAIIAAELGTVVIGGIISSTLLMLLIVPAAYYVFTPAHDWILGLFGVSSTNNDATEQSDVASEKQK